MDSLKNRKKTDSETIISQPKKNHLEPKNPLVLLLPGGPQIEPREEIVEGGGGLDNMRLAPSINVKLVSSEVSVSAHVETSPRATSQGVNVLSSTHMSSTLTTSAEGNALK